MDWQESSPAEMHTTGTVPDEMAKRLQLKLESSGNKSFAIFLKSGFLQGFTSISALFLSKTQQYRSWFVTQKHEMLLKSILFICFFSIYES